MGNSVRTTGVEGKLGGGGLRGKNWDNCNNINNNIFKNYASRRYSKKYIKISK